MRVAVFGASGFMGYDCLRTLRDEFGIDPIAYAGGYHGLVNLARHRLDLRVVPPGELPGHDLDPDVETVVNFSHPFRVRDGLSPTEQLDCFVDFLSRNLARRADLRLIQLSSMAVYEPFEQPGAAQEARPLAPPQDDPYSQQKVYLEGRLASLGVAAAVLRPTIVYGPYSRYFTDHLMSAFAAGDVAYHDLGGRLQPIFVRDASRLVAHLITKFEAGTVNLAGPETLTWEEYFRFFREIVAQGELVCDPTIRRPAPDRSWAGRLRTNLADLSSLLGSISRDPALHRLLRPLKANIPDGLRSGIRRLVRGPDPDRPPEPPARSSSPPAPNGNSVDSMTAELKGVLASDYFSRDRLVSTGLLHRRFSEFQWTRLAEATTVLRDYYEFRFTDG